LISGNRSVTSASVSYVGQSNGDQAGYALAIGPDLTGSGVNSVVVAAPGASSSQGTLYLLGTTGPTVNLPSGTETRGSSGEKLGLALLAAGDIQNDGYDDLVAVCNGNVYLLDQGHFGGTVSTIAAITLTGMGTIDLGVTLSSSDFNMDGHEDLAVGIPGYDNGTADSGRVAVQYGPLVTGNIFSNADSSYTGTSGEKAGSGLTSYDNNGDGYADLALGAPAAAFNLGAVLVFEAPIPSTLSIGSEDVSLVGSNPGDLLGGGLALAGDLNGDGYEDLMASESNRSRVYVIPGHLSGSQSLTTAFITFSGTNSFGNAILGDLDLDADGNTEVAISDSSSSTTWIFEAPLSGNVATGSAIATLTGSQNTGATLAAGDANDDGIDDLLVGGSSATGQAAGSGSAWLFWGTP